MGNADLGEGGLARMLQLHEVDIIGAELTQRGRAGSPDPEPAHDRRRAAENLAFLRGRPAAGDVELQKLAEQIDRETDPSAIEDGLPRPIKDAHEFGAVDPRHHGPELVGGRGDVEPADFYVQHPLALLTVQVGRSRRLPRNLPTTRWRIAQLRTAQAPCQTNLLPNDP